MELDKEYLISQFKRFLDKSNYEKPDKFDKYQSPESKSAGHLSKFEILKKIQELYKFFFEESKILIKREFIHDDDKYALVSGKIRSYVGSKIRVGNGGDLYINVNDKIRFDGSEEQYEEWLINDKRKIDILARSIIDELNNMLGGDPIIDHNKPLLNDSKECATYILNYIPDEVILECFRGNYRDFNKTMYVVLTENFRLRDESVWEIISNFRNNFAFNEVLISKLEK